MSRTFRKVHPKKVAGKAFGLNDCGRRMRRHHIVTPEDLDFSLQMHISDIRQLVLGLRPQSYIHRGPESFMSWDYAGNLPQKPLARRWHRRERRTMKLKLRKFSE